MWKLQEKKDQGQHLELLQWPQFWLDTGLKLRSTWSQCDEGRPECGNCGSFGVNCDYVAGTTTLQEAALERRLFLNTRVGSRLHGKRGRPRTRWAVEDEPSPQVELAAPSASDSNSVSSGRAPEPPSEREPEPARPGEPELPQYVDELRLLHHYLELEFKGTGDRPLTFDALRLQAPQLGLTHPFVLHMVYEFAALSFAREQPPERKEHYHSLAAHYSTLGLHKVTEMLPKIDTQNCHAVYTAAVFACINTFARGPQPGDYLLFSEHGSPQWLPLLRGVRTLVDTIGVHTVASGPQGDRPVDPSPKATEPATAAFSLRGTRLDWAGQFERLGELVNTSTGATGVAVNAKALEQLRMCYWATYGGEDGEYHGDANHQNLFIWPYQLEDAFTDALQGRDQAALVILAHFAVLLKLFGFSIWFLQGWSEHLLDGARKFLDKCHRAWLEWPLEQTARMDRERRETQK